MAAQVPEFDVDLIMKRVQNKMGKVSLEECAFLKSHGDPAKEFPSYCSKLLQNAHTRGILARRNSSIAQTWKLGEHGSNRLRPTEVVDSLDSVSSPNAESTHEIYMKSRTPEQQEKIRRLIVRTASRGARPRVDFDVWAGKEENQKEVHREVRRELVRRKSRREELKKKVDYGLAA